MRATPTLLALTTLTGLAGCGPVRVDQAERQCLDQAQLAQKPRVRVELTAGSGGQIRAALDMEITSDYLAGRDPSAVFIACVMRASGQYPSRTLAQMPGWRD